MNNDFRKKLMYLKCAPKSHGDTVAVSLLFNLNDFRLMAWFCGFVHSHFFFISMLFLVHFPFVVPHASVVHVPLRQ